MAAMNRFYIVRLRKNDDIVAVGNALQCALKLGMTLNVFYQTVCNCKRGKNKKYEIDVEAGDEEV